LTIKAIKSPLNGRRAQYFLKILTLKRNYEKIERVSDATWPLLTISLTFAKLFVHVVFLIAGCNMWQ
jgi:hypothetical protein